jgi:hypothetical protein
MFPGDFLRAKSALVAVKRLYSILRRWLASPLLNHDADK